MNRPLPLAALFLAALAASGQTTGTLEGTVSESSGGLVQGADVRITESLTGATRHITTGARGSFLATGFAPGLYEVHVARQGFDVAVRNRIELAAGRTVRVDFQLTLGVRRESVVVQADVALLATSSTDWGRSVDRAQLESLPLNGRDLFDLAAQQPGAIRPSTSSKNLTSGGGNHISLNGARPNQAGFRLDGIHINDASGTAPTSAAGTLLGLEAVEELRLVVSPFSAEYGRAAGGIVTAVSKSGTNDLHGSVYGLLRNSALDARNFFDSARKPPLRRGQFGALLSGPVRRNKLFFLANYEGLREFSGTTLRPVTLSDSGRQGNLGSRSVQVAAAVKPFLDLFPRANARDFGDGTAEFVTDQNTQVREDFVTASLTGEISPLLRAAVRYSFDDARRQYPDGFHLWNLLDTSRHQFVRTELQILQSALSTHMLQAGFSRVRNTEAASLIRDISPSLSFLPGESLGTMQIVGLSDFGGLIVRQRPRQYIVNDYQLNYTASLLRGRHLWRFGAGVDRIQFNQMNDLGRAGNYRFNSVAEFLTARPRSADFMMTGSDSIRGWRQVLFNWFLQDEFRPHRDLSVTAGLRYEAYTVPTEVNGKIATLRNPYTDPDVTVGGALFVNPSKRNLTPRLSLAWNPAGGKTVLRAGAGMFIDVLSTRELVIAGTRMPPFFLRLFPNNPPFPGLASTVGASAQKAPDGLDYFMEQPRTLQYKFGLERQLGATTLLQAEFVGARGLHLPGYISNINTPTPQRLPDGRMYFSATAPRANPAFDQIATRRMQFDSVYDALILSAQQRWWRGLWAQAKYTWSKSLDNTSSSIFGDHLQSDRLPTMYDYRMNRGPSDFDLRHAFAANFAWRLPGASRRWIGGWELHGLGQVQTGHPFGPFVGYDRANLRASSGDMGQRPDFIGPSTILGRPEQYFDPSAYSLPAAGTYGNLGRNTLSGPGLVNFDAALSKAWRLREQSALQLRLEMFNLANRANFQVPSDLGIFNSQGQRVSSAGRITSTATTARQIQFALKYRF